MFIYKGKFHTFCEMGEVVSGSAAAYYAEELKFAATELEYCIKVRYKHDYNIILVSTLSALLSFK